MAADDDEQAQGGGVGVLHKDAKKQHRDQVILIAVGILGVILTYAYIKSRSSSTAATTSGSAVGSNPTGQVAGYGAPGYSSSGASWQDALALFENQQSQANQQLTDAINAQNTANQQATSGFQTAITNLETEIQGLSTGSNPPQNPTNAAGSYANAPANMVGNLVAEIAQPGGGIDYVTSAGAVYSEGGAQYYGGTNPGGNQPGNPWGNFDVVGGTAASGGGYTLFNQQGQAYTFGPGPGQYQQGVGFH